MIKTFVKITTLSALLFLISCNKMPSNEKMAKAKQHYNAEEYQAAIIQLKNLIKDEPQNNSARLLMAKSQYQLGNFLSAEKEFIRAIELGTAKNDIALMYTSTLYALEDYTGLEDFWIENEKQLNKQSKAQITPIISLAYLNLTKGQKSFELASTGKALANKLKSKELMLINNAIANSYNPDANIEETITTLSNACQQYPQRWIVCNLLANALFSEKKYTDAAKIYEKILTNKPNYTALVVKLADSYVRAEDLEKAKRLVNALLQKFPNQAYVNLLAATINLKELKYVEALNHVNKTINAGLNTPQTKLIASLAHYHLGNDEQALYHLQSLRATFPNDPLITKLYIAIQIHLGNDNSLSNAYSQAVESETTSEMFALASIDLFKIGQLEKANKLLNEIDISLIRDQKVLNSISLIKLASGNNNVIKDLEMRLKELTQTNDNLKEISNIKILLISSLLANKENAKAEVYTNQWLSQAPNNIENNLLAIEVEKKKELPDTNKITQIFEKILKLEPDNEFANIFFGQTSLQNQKAEQAQQFFNIAVEKNKFNTLAIQGLIASRNAQGNSSEEFTTLINKYQNYEQNFQERTTLARIYFLLEKPEKTIELLEKVTNQQEVKQVQELLAQAYIAERNYDKVITTFTNLFSNEAPKDSELNLLALAYEKSKKIPDAVKSFEKLKTSYPDNSKVELLLANFYLFNNQANKSLAYISSLSEEQQDHPVIKGLKGKALYFLQKFDQALPLLLASYKSTNNSKLMPFIFDTKVNLNKVDDALKEMELYLTEHPQEIASRLYYANTLNEHDKHKAITEYQHILMMSGSNLLALNNLAWLLYESGDLIEAKKYIDQAIKLAPNHPEVIDTLNKINNALKN